jgi:nucleoid-associated protein YgaU
VTSDLRLAALVLAAVLALAGCKAEQKSQTQGTAGGEVLPGTVSDAMLPIDSVRSQPPLAPRPTAAGKAAGTADAAASEAAPAEAVGPAEAPAGEAPL